MINLKKFYTKLRMFKNFYKKVIQNFESLFYLKYVYLCKLIKYYEFLKLSCSKNDIMMTT